MAIPFQGAGRAVSPLAGATDFEIQHRPGKKHLNVDALSRILCKQCGRTEEDLVDHKIGAVQQSPPVVLEGKSDAVTRQMQLKDDAIGFILRA